MRINKSILFLSICMTLVSCAATSKEDMNPTSEGTYILNNGNWGGNDSNIGIYDPVGKTFTSNAFFSANGQKLGDLGQDIIRHGENVYIAVNGSQTIFVTDVYLNIVQQINAVKDGSRLSPRAFASSGEKLYVTYYEGYVGEISSEQEVRLCQVGPNPEGIAAAGNRLYIANSGGMSYPQYNNTVSVVSTASFTETESLEVNVNPANVEASSDGAYIYVSSFGNYSDIPAKLQVIDASTGKVSDLEYESVSAIAKGNDDTLYILCGGYDENWNPLPGAVYKHDMKSNLSLGRFVTDGTVMPNAYSISATSDGYVYVGCSDYKTTGDVYVFTSEGKLHDKFDSHGLNPIAACR